MSEKLSERLEALAISVECDTYTHEEVALLREAAAALRAVEGAVQADLIGECHDGNNYHLMCDTWQEDMRIEKLFGQRVALVPLDAAGSAEGVDGG